MGVGKIQEFDVKSGNWVSYSERLDMYFLANDVKDSAKLPTLIAVMGEEAYLLLSTLASPKKPSTLSYDEAISLMKDHLQPKPSILAERYKFRQRRQVETESIANYVAELKKLAKDCDFKTTLEENLRDQLVCGIISETTRQRLFAEDDSITYRRAFKLATSLEAAEKNACAVDRDTKPSVPVNKVQGVFKCMACGTNGHRTEDCKYKNFECSSCRKVGHLRRMCPEKRARLDVAGTAKNQLRGDGGSEDGGRWERGGRRAGGGRGAGTSGRWRGRPAAARSGGRDAGSYWLHGEGAAAPEQVPDPQLTACEDDAFGPRYEDDGSDDLDEPMYQMSLTKYKPA